MCVMNDSGVHEYILCERNYAINGHNMVAWVLVMGLSYMLT